LCAASAAFAQLPAGTHLQVTNMVTSGTEATLQWEAIAAPRVPKLYSSSGLAGGSWTEITGAKLKSISATGAVITHVEGVNDFIRLHAVYPPPAVPVTDITGVPTSVIAWGLGPKLTGAVQPSGASVKTPVIWTVVDKGGSDAVVKDLSPVGLTGLALDGTTPGDFALTVRATIPGAAEGGADFVKDFDIDFHVCSWGGVDHTIMIDMDPASMVGGKFKVSRVGTGAALDLPLASDDNARTKHLYMRYIKPGCFVIGSPDDGVGAGKVTATQPAESGNSTNNRQKHVHITQGYYLSVYPLTVSQYNHATAASIPAASPGTDGTPKISIRWSRLRNGVDGTGAGNDSDPNTAPSFNSDIGIFRSRLPAPLDEMLDLPTEAQWEYACRAGKKGSYSDDDVITTTSSTPTLDQRMLGLGWYGNTVNGTTGNTTAKQVVGTKPPAAGAVYFNAAGLNDMHGNV
jgi:formylglycine-generating enzyme required for sulfatase activity